MRELRFFVQMIFFSRRIGKYAVYIHLSHTSSWTSSTKAICTITTYTALRYTLIRLSAFPFDVSIAGKFCNWHIRSVCLHRKNVRERSLATAVLYARTTQYQTTATHFSFFGLLYISFDRATWIALPTRQCESVWQNECKARKFISFASRRIWDAILLLGSRFFSPYVVCVRVRASIRDLFWFHLCFSHHKLIWYIRYSIFAHSCIW